MAHTRSPFPGMDPYLEHPARWRDVHSALVAYLRDDIQGALPGRYYARMEDRVYIDSQQYGIAPDVRVVERGEPSGTVVSAPADADTAVIIEIPSVEVEEHYVEIRDAESGDQVVTVIEVLSPGNKRPGTDGALSYRSRQAEILGSQANLVEIDLLRAGEHVTCVPKETAQRCGSYHYLTVVRRATRPSRRELYPISLRSRLPRIAVPLKLPDADVVADLQSLVERAYERGAYGKTINYQRPPEPPLAPADEVWAREISSRKS